MARVETLVVAAQMTRLHLNTILEEAHFLVQSFRPCLFYLSKAILLQLFRPKTIFNTWFRDLPAVEVVAAREETSSCVPSVGHLANMWPLSLPAQGWLGVLLSDALYN